MNVNDILKAKQDGAENMEESIARIKAAIQKATSSAFEPIQSAADETIQALKKASGLGQFGLVATQSHLDAIKALAGGAVLPLNEHLKELADQYKSMTNPFAEHGEQIFAEQREYIQNIMERTVGILPTPTDDYPDKNHFQIKVPEIQERFFPVPMRENIETQNYAQNKIDDIRERFEVAKLECEIDEEINLFVIDGGQKLRVCDFIAFDNIEIKVIGEVEENGNKVDYFVPYDKIKIWHEKRKIQFSSKVIH